MPARRLAIFLGVMLLLALASVAIAPPRERGPDLTPPRSATTAAPDAEAGDGAGAAPVSKDGVVTASLSPDTPERDSRVQAQVGDLVRLSVSSEKLDTVTVGDLKTRAVEPGVPARFELTATAPGRYPIMLQAARVQVGTLLVSG